MSNVELNYDAMRSNCVLVLEDVVNAIQKSINYFYQISIPSDFSRKQSLKRAASDLNRCKKEINNIRNLIINSNNNYDSLISNLSKQSESLPNCQIKKRTNII